MTPLRAINFLAGAALIPPVALTVAACGGSGAATAATPKTSRGASATVGIANSGLGSILVATGKPTAGTALDSAELGTITRADDIRQVTYNRHPLYRFSDEQTPGDTNGEGVTAFGAAWFALSPAGNQVSAARSSSGGGASSGGGGY